MKVKDIIEVLQTYDPELSLMVDGYEGGITEEDVFIRLVSVNRNANLGSRFLGEHDEDIYAKNPHDQAVLISRDKE